ncbi:MAG TPA: hypothetical protein VHX61_13545 [Rhizomicrobium sp.]|nr:hypothetical protein [Rhizomicrobium sp.]
MFMLRFETGEIHDVAPDGLLPAEFVFMEAAVAQCVPKLAL